MARVPARTPTTDRHKRLDGSGTAETRTRTLSRPMISSGDDGTPLSSTQRRSRFEPTFHGLLRLNVVAGTLVTPTVLGTMTGAPEPVSPGRTCGTSVKVAPLSRL